MLAVRLAAALDARLAALAGCALGIVACGSPSATTSPADSGAVLDGREASSALVAVAVEHGYGGGRFAVGSTIHVWSDVNPQAGLTTGWIGPPGVPTEWNGAFVVQEQDVTLSATIAIDPAPLVMRTYRLAAGPRTVLGYFPAKAKNLALFFHGANFDISHLRFDAAATITIALARAGYAVVAPPSEAETASGVGGWNYAVSGNTDLDNVVALVKALRADGSVPPSAKIVSWGMSSGGYFAHTVGAKLPADVVTAYCAPGIAGAISITHAPTAWYLAADDQTIPTSVEESTAFQKQLDARGIATELYVHPQTPLYEQRFMRVAGVDAARSRTIAASLLAHKDVDTHGNWLVTGSSIAMSLELGGLAGLSAAQRTAVGQEIDIMAADHALYDDVANRMMAFILAH